MKKKLHRCLAVLESVLKRAGRDCQGQVFGQPGLFLYEWFALLLLFGFIFILCALSSLEQNGEDLPCVVSKIQVEVAGALKSPGVYTLDEGTTLGGLLKRLELDPDADKASLKKRERLQQGQKIEVLRKPKRKSSSGAVKTGLRK